MLMKNTKPRNANPNNNPNKGHIEAIQVSESRHYSGPLPLPEDLAKYDQIVPGAAERIIKMAENEMQHRHNNDNKVTKNIIITTYLSIAAAFICVLIMSGLVFYALYKGFSTVAGTIAVGSIAAVASVFFIRKKEKEH